MSIKVGVLCPSEIAFRRFLPSLKQVPEFSFVGIAIATPKEWANNERVNQHVIDIINKEHEKAQKFVDVFGGKIFEGYQTLVSSKEIDVVYIPLPPSLHYKWARISMEYGKHVFVEKPFTTNIDDTLSLLSIAREKNLAVHENYMFIYHRQLQSINELIASGEIGKVRQYRISFGFPRRSANDFRYNKVLGGGALLDAGGYCIRYASFLLGNSARLVCANTIYEKEFKVDIFGSCTMVNNEGTIAQLSFGMDNDYKCELEAWGSTGTITTGRVLTAPDGFEPDLVIKHNQDFIKRKLPFDAAFEKSIRNFYDCMMIDSVRSDNYSIIERQSILINEFMNLSNYEK